MKLEHLNEMAAKKICPQCGKTMAANHYWYKGGWRCKKSSQQPTEDGAQLSKSTPAVEQPKPSAAQPAKPAQPTVGVDVAAVRALIPELDWQGEDDNPVIWWDVSQRGDTIEVFWTITYRRDTPMGAYQEYSRHVKFANTRLNTIATKFPDSVIRLTPLTAAEVERREAIMQMNGEPLYSEYEGSIGGSIFLKAA